MHDRFLSQPIRFILYNTFMRSFLQRVWRSLSSVPLWMKILGIVVLPLSLVTLIAALVIRYEIQSLGAQQGVSAEILNILPQLSRDMVLIIAATAGLGLLMAFVMSLVLARPLQQLLEAMQRVQAGDLSSRANVWADDEIGAVQAAFNRMVASLEASQAAQNQLNQELGMLNQLLTVAAFTENVQGVIPSALEQAAAILGADVGTFYRYEAREQSFLLEAHHGFLPDEAPLLNARRSLITTPMRRTLEEGRPIILTEAQHAEELPPEIASSLEAAGFHTFISAPVRVQGEICGIINLGKRGHMTFSPENLALLESVCSIVGIGLENGRLVEGLRVKEAEMRHALQRAVDLQEDERRRISRELHDEIGQALTSILIRLKTLQQETRDADVVDRLDGLRYLTGQTIEELRRLAMDLRPAALDNLGIVPALHWYVEQTSSNTGRSITFTGPEQALRLPEEIEIVLYRTAQEGINNALRHGDARQIQLTMGGRKDAVWLEIRDDGQGFDPADVTRGLGLVGLRERLSLFEGRFDVHSKPGSGTRLWIEIPLAETREAA